jgi:hypothetical protein
LPGFTIQVLGHRVSGLGTLTNSRHELATRGCGAAAVRTRLLQRNRLCLLLCHRMPRVPHANPEQAPVFRALCAPCGHGARKSWERRRPARSWTLNRSRLPNRKTLVRAGLGMQGFVDGLIDTLVESVCMFVKALALWTRVVCGTVPVVRLLDFYLGRQEALTWAAGNRRSQPAGPIQTLKRESQT